MRYCLLALFFAASLSAQTRVVPDDAMRKVYEELKTPYKYGIVLRAERGLVDCPRVFRHGGKWYMHYIGMDKEGYESYLAESEDLLHWKPLGKILSFPQSGWDRWQSAGAVALIDPNWEGTNEPERYKGRYWFSYLGGALQGYETDPLSIGMATSHSLTLATEWTRLPQNPVLSREQADVREFEKMTLYRSTILRDKRKTLGAEFVMYYNGKLKNGYERIGMATSADMVHWKRYGTGPVVANGEREQRGISGDPQIVRMGELWVMIYFGAGWKPKAFDTFAASHDMVNWTKWEGPHLIEPSEPWDNKYAHKPWMVKHNGVVYHFYCAVGAEGRAIAVATSRDLRAPAAAR